MKTPGFKKDYGEEEKPSLKKRQKIGYVIGGLSIGFILAFLLLSINLSINYYESYKDSSPDYQELYEEKLQNETYQEYFINGSIYGYNLAHLEIFNEVSKCGRFPVTIQNISYNLIAEECLEVER